MSTSIDCLQSTGARIIIAFFAGLILALAVRADDTQTPITLFQYVGQQDLQAVVDRAPSHSVVVCDRNKQLTLATAVKIRKPLTLQGLNARLPDGLGQTPLVVVEANGVTVKDFVLKGNIDTVDQKIRSALLVVLASDFRVQNGVFINSSKDGVSIDSSNPGEDVKGGVVRDLTGYNIGRDVVSISGGPEGGRITNVLVDNIRCYGSPYRGAVEVSDGTDNITVRKVYAENCVYAVDVQDHGEKTQVNTNVLIEDVYAKNCRWAVRNANRPFGHNNLTLRDITARGCESALRLRNTDRLTVQNVRVIDHERGIPITITNCHGVSLRDVAIENARPDETAIRIEDCNNVFVHGVTFQGNADNLKSVLHYRILSDESFSGLRISGVMAGKLSTPGVLLESTSKKATLTDYLVSDNLTSVEDRIKGMRGFTTNNLQAR